MITGVRAEAVECSEPSCRLPAAYVLGTLVMIESHHHGHRHTTILSAVELRVLLDRIERPMLR